MISATTIEEIKERASLVDLVGEQTQLKRNGAHFTALCPFHSEKTPSFHIRDNGRYYHCFGCGVSGNVITYVMESRGLSFPDAVEELAARYGIEVRREGGTAQKQEAPHRDILFAINNMAQEFFRSQLASAPAQVKEYLTSRHINEKALHEFGFGYAPAVWGALAEELKRNKFDEALLLQSGLIRRSPRGDLYDTFRARIIFPILIEGRKIAGFGGRIVPALAEDSAARNAPKYLNSPETPVYQKNRILFGLPQALDAIRKVKEVYLVEGYMDVVGLWQAGVRNVVATCGTAVSEQHVKRLQHLVERVHVLFDGDVAGRTAAAKCFPIFLNSGIDVHALFIPDGEDPDTLALQHGARTEAYLKQLERVSLLDCFIDSLLARAGWKDAKDMGAAAKGKLAEELVAVLRRVRNTIELSDLLQRAALKLLVDPKDLQALVKPDGTSSPTSVQESSPQKRSEETQAVLQVEKLPLADRELLHAAMVLKERVTSELLRDADICEGLHPSTLRFIEGLHAVVSEAGRSDSEKRETIKGLLKEFGDSWTVHWRRSYEMEGDSEVDFERSVLECRSHFKKLKLNQAITEIDVRMSQLEAMEHKAELAHEKILLKRRLEQL